MRPVDYTMLEPSSDFSVVSINQAEATCIVEGGSCKSERLKGVYLEGTWTIHGDVLVALSYDCPHEETLHFYLLDHSLSTIERVTFGLPFQPGIFEPVNIDGNRLDFNFVKGSPWSLIVHRSSRFPVLPFVPFIGVRGSFSFKKRLEVRRAPGLVRNHGPSVDL